MSSSSARIRRIALPLPGSPPAPTVPRATRFTLDNGLRVLAVERPGLPQIAARLVVPAGSTADLDHAPGVASLTASLLTEGTSRRSAVQVNEAIDSLGASLCARAGHDFADVDLSLLSETADAAFELLADVVSDPVFPEREVERIRSEVLDALEARLDEPADVADDEAARAVFGTHPYGRLPVGTKEGVAAIRREDIAAFHTARYRPAGSVLVVAGDFRIDHLRRTLERTLGRWEGSVERALYPDPPTAAVMAGAVRSIRREEAAQGEIRVAGIGLSRRSPDWIPAGVANYVLGGSTITGRLGANLREEKGWTYGVRSSMAAGVHPGGWVIETAVDAGVATHALSEIIREVERLCTEPVSDEELVRAKEALILSLPRAFETPGRIVARLATVEAFGLPEDYWESFPDHVQAVSTDEVLRTASTYFDPAGLVRVVVGPPLEGA